MSKQEEGTKDLIFVGGRVEGGPGLTILWQGGIEVKITDEFGEDKKALIRRFCGIEAFNKYIGFGFFILNPIDYKIERCVMNIVFPGDDIFVAFRAMQAMHYMDKLSNKGERSFLLWRALCRNVFEREKAWLKNMIGEQKFQEIFTTVIPDMEKVISILAARGVRLDPAKFQEEIDAGMIQYAEYLRPFNVESPEVRKERSEKRSKITAPYRDKVIKCVTPSRFVEQTPSALVDTIDKIIYGSISRGTRGEAETIGVSVGRIWYESMLVDIMKRNGTSGAYFGMVDENKVRNFVSGEVAKSVTAELSEKFPEIFLPEGYTEIVRTFLKNWENMPEVDI